MSAQPIAVPYEKQIDPQLHRGCGAACLSMVYRSFGKEVSQAEIWPLIAKQNKFGAISSTTHLMAQHAASLGFSAVVIQARHPIQVLRLCRANGIGAILNHRLQPDSSSGHFSVLVDIDNSHVVLHDPLLGASRQLSYSDLVQLWLPQSSQSEIVGNVVIGIAADPAPIPACEFCHTAIPPAVDCPRCKKRVGLLPATVLGCIRDGCIARMWNYVCCPACDFVWSFNEAGVTSASPLAAAAAATGLPIGEPQDLEKVFAELDKFCNLALSVPGAADNADLKAQVNFMMAGKDRLRVAQMEEAAAFRSHTSTIDSFARESSQKAEAHRKKVEELKTPPAPLDGNALGQALLKNLGFK